MARPRSSLWQKQFPTIIGVGVLILALAAGVFFIGEGPGVFAPRAAPETTPQKVQVTNVTDNWFTVSFYTDESTPGFVRYGTEASNLRSQASDDRDQLSGSVGSYKLHHITVRGLSPNTTYYYVLGTGSRATFDNNGSPFSVTTAQRGGTPSAAETAYGNVLAPDGSPAEGAIVYATISGVGPLSSLVKASGSWAIPLANARTTDGSAYAEISDNQPIQLLVQGTQANLTSSATVTVAEALPVDNITLGQGGPALTAETKAGDAQANVTARADQTVSTQSSLDTEPGLGNDSSDETATASSTTNGLGGLGELSTTTSTDSAEVVSTTVDVDSIEVRTVQEPPKIVGKAAPDAAVQITVNSDTQIVRTVTTDSDGNFELDLATIAESSELEEGEHTVTATYIDPETGQTITKQQTFTLDSTGSLLAQANTNTSTGSFGQAGTGGTTPSPSPFSSGDPFTLEDSTTSASASPSASPEVGGTKGSTRSGQVATSAALPQSGSVGTTLALVLGGLFFIFSGVWSFWISQQLEEKLALAEI